MAGGHRPFDRSEQWDFGAAPLVLERMEAAGVKGTPGGGLDGLGRSPPSTMRARGGSRGRARDRREQSDGVGVSRIGEDLIGGPLFDDMSQVHHRDSMSDLSHDGEIVGDKQVREAALRAGDRIAG